MDDLDLKKIEDSLNIPWDMKGMTPEEYAQDLTERWQNINNLVNSGRGDTSIVKSTLSETLQFFVWASAKKELSSCLALVRAHMTRLNHGKQHKSRTARLNKKREL